MDIEASIKEDMTKLGCNSEKKLCAAYHLYMYLIDEKLMYDTEYCYNKDIDVLYIVAKPTKNGKTNIYVPIPTFDEVSMDFIRTLQDNLCTVETGPSLNLAFIEGDSTTVIYTFTKGILDRPSQEKIDAYRTKAERRIYINNELRKNKDTYLDQALNGGNLDDDICEEVS